MQISSITFHRIRGKGGDGSIFRPPIGYLFLVYLIFDTEGFLRGERAFPSLLVLGCGRAGGGGMRAASGAPAAGSARRCEGNRACGMEVSGLQRGAGQLRCPAGGARRLPGVFPRRDAKPGPGGPRGLPLHERLLGGLMDGAVDDDVVHGGVSFGTRHDEQVRRLQRSRAAGGAAAGPGPGPDDAGGDPEEERIRHRGLHGERRGQRRLRLPAGLRRLLPREGDLRRLRQQRAAGPRLAAGTPGPEVLPVSPRLRRARPVPGGGGARSPLRGRGLRRAFHRDAAGAGNPARGGAGQGPRGTPGGGCAFLAGGVRREDPAGRCSVRAVPAGVREAGSGGADAVRARFCCTCRWRSSCPEDMRPGRSRIG